MQLLSFLWFAGVSAQAPPSGQSLLQVAHTEIIAGRLTEAEQTARRALASLGADAPLDSRVAAHQVLGTVLANMGRTREAWEEAEKAIALGPKGVRLGGLKHTLAMLAWAAGDVDLAARWMEQALVLLEPSDEVWEATIDLAGLEMVRGKRSRAAGLCAKALPRLTGLRGQNHPVVANRAYTCAVIRMEKEPELAEQQLNQLLAAGSLPDVRRAILLAQIARARLRTKRRDDALLAIDQATQLARAASDEPLLGPFLHIRATVLRALKRKNEAAQCEYEAAELSRAKPGILVDAAMLRAGALR